MTAFVLTAQHSIEHLLPVSALLTGSAVTVFEGTSGLLPAIDQATAQARVEGDTRARCVLWIFDQTTFVTYASALADRANDLEINLCLRRRGSSLSEATALEALSLGGFRFQLWTIRPNADAWRSLTGEKGLTVLPLVPGEGLAEASVTDSPHWEISAANKILIPVDPDHREQGTQSQPFSLPPLITAARRGAARPDCRSAPLDAQDLTELVWRLRQQDHAALQPENTPRTEASDHALEVLFFIPNGMGLGHLSRTLAVAKALETQLGLAPHQIGFWSYSLASALIQQAGYRIIPRQTAKQLGIDGNRWEARETEDLQAYLAARRPRRIIIDHATLETAIMESLETLTFPCVKIWLRRAFWRKTHTAPGFGPISRFDAIITPGDLSGASDPGPLRRFSQLPYGSRSLDHQTPHFHAAPVVLGRDSPPVPLQRTRFRLGNIGKRPVLVSLGGAGLLAYPELMTALERAAVNHRIALSWILPPLAPGGLLHRLNPRVSSILPFVFPLAPHLKHGAGTILGGGYNSCHEAMLTSDKPVLFVPNEDTARDDQTSRVAHLVKQGWAHQIALSDPAPWDQQLDAFFAEVRSNRPAPRPPIDRLPNGAVQIAKFIRDLTP